MSTRLQIILVSIIAVMAALGFAATQIISMDFDREQNSSQVEEADEDMQTDIHDVTDASTENNVFEGFSGFEFIMQQPDVERFTVSSGTFLVIHWNADGGDTASMVSVWYSKKGEYPSEVFTDQTNSCGQPYDYGINAGYFYISRTVTPCEAISDTVTRWYRDDGKEVLRTAMHESAGDPVFTYQFPGKAVESIQFIYDEDCDDIPIPDDLFTNPAPENERYFVHMTGIRVGRTLIPLTPARTIACALNLLNDAFYYPTPTSIIERGQQLRIVLPTDENIRVNLAAPEEYEFYPWGAD